MSQERCRTSKAALAALILALPVAVAVPGASAQDVAEVLDRHYAAMGGAQAWKDTETVSMAGSISILNGMMEGPFTIVQKRPTLSHMTFVIQGQEVVQAFDGETAWQIVPMMGQTQPTEADPATAAEIRDGADLDGPLLGWEEDGHEIELVGRSTIGEEELIELEVTMSHGTTIRYFLDAGTYLPARIESETPAGASQETDRCPELSPVETLKAR